MRIWLICRFANHDPEIDFGIMVSILKKIILSAIHSNMSNF